MISIDNDNYQYWQVKISDLIVQGQSVFSNSQTNAILDSGTLLTLVPLREITRIEKEISKKIQSLACSAGSQIQCLFFDKCSNIAPKLDSIQFKLTGEWGFNVAPEDFLIDYKYQSLDICILGFIGADAGGFILGDTFLRSFLSVYDFENKRVGLVPHLYSKGSITQYSLENDSGMKPWVIAVIAVSSLLVLIGIILVVCKIRKNNRTQYKDIGDSNASLVHGNRV